VTVRGAAEQLQDLEAAVDALGLPPGTERSLLAKLDAALASVGRGPTAPSCGQLGAFASGARAQAGKSLSAAQTSDLLAASAQVGDVLGCG
jgi:hypothetical protein